MSSNSDTDETSTRAVAGKADASTQTDSFGDDSKFVLTAAEETVLREFVAEKDSIERRGIRWTSDKIMSYTMPGLWSIDRQLVLDEEQNRIVVDTANLYKGERGRDVMAIFLRRDIEAWAWKNKD